MNSEKVSNLEWNFFIKIFVNVLKDDVGVVDEIKLEDDLTSLFGATVIKEQLYEYAAVALKRAYSALPMKKGDLNMVKLVIELLPIYKIKAPKVLSNFIDMITDSDGDCLDYGHVYVTEPLPRRRSLSAMDCLRTLTPFMNLGTTLLPYVSVLHRDTLCLEPKTVTNTSTNTAVWHTSRRLLLFVKATGPSQLNVHNDMSIFIKEALSANNISQEFEHWDLVDLKIIEGNSLLLKNTFSIESELKLSSNMRVAVLVDSILTCRKESEHHEITINPLHFRYGDKEVKTVIYFNFESI